MQLPKPTTALSQIANIALQRLNSSESVVSSTLWRDRPLLIHIVRRPGCQFCREAAVELTAQRPLITGKMGVDMVAVVHEEFGAQEFNDGYFKGPLYVDKERGFFTAIGGGKLNWGGMTTFMTPTFWKNYFRSSKTGVAGNLKGEGRIMGGLYVIGKGDSGIVYEFSEQVFGDQPPIRDVLEACRQASETPVTEEEIEKVLST